MEYLNGGDLYSMLRNLGCLDENMARVYIAEVVSILTTLVFHQDTNKFSLQLCLCSLFFSSYPLGRSTGSCIGVFAFLKCDSQRLEAR